MPRIPPEQRDHRDWLALIQPTGLVVAPSALVRAGAVLPRRDIEGQRRLREWRRQFDDDKAQRVPPATAFRAFAEQVLDWDFSLDDYVESNGGATGLPTVSLPEYDEVLSADLAVRRTPSATAAGKAAKADAARGDAEASRWQLLVSHYGREQDLDKPFEARGRGRLSDSPSGRMERLLRETGTPAGIVWGGGRLRLISAPRGESSGQLDFVVSQMAETAGRPLLAALRLLLRQNRLLTLPTTKRLPALLAESRKYQNEVSVKLAGQVLEGLYALLRGIDAADAELGGELLRETMEDAPEEVYRGLLAVILRLVFILYAEQRDLLPQDETFVRHYSLTRLFQRLRADHALHPDTMDQRYGAWAQLLTLFRMVHDGAEAEDMRLPARHGALFDPDRHPFLEGRPRAGGRQIHERIEVPRVSDGTVLELLRKLLVLDGDRISYRALDVEQIGSVYETMMGFRLERASGPSLAIRSPKKHGAPSIVDLQALLDAPSGSRGRWVQQATDRKLTDRVLKAVAAAAGVEQLHAALDPVVDRAATPDIAAPGSLILQPTEERRRSGSHYTPRALTGPIVKRTLEPVLARLRAGGATLRPEQILDLRVCDPAMGSGAFLVEACRQLGDALQEAWKLHGKPPGVPPKEDETIVARRMVAERCLYGVDRNPVAVDLAKLSLWLATLAKDHPLTFLDHALKWGDSLVGLSRGQIERAHWNPGGAPDFFAHQETRRALEEVTRLRREIREAGSEVSDTARRALWKDGESALASVRLFADLVVGSFFEGEKAADREAKRKQAAAAISQGEAETLQPGVEALREAHPPLAPFHWEIEFPEVFDRKNPGFDAFVGNPPFAGKNTVNAGNPPRYLDWLKQVDSESHGNSDLVAHFFRRGFALLRDGGCLGLIATNTISQGDTRFTGLRWIATNGGEIYDATRRYEWPGEAAVVVSVIHLSRGAPGVERRLDGVAVPTITAFLFPKGGHESPKKLRANANRSFQGTILLGVGFTFDDTDAKGVASPLAERERLLAADPRNAEVIQPYIGGKEVVSSPTHAHHRYAINFRDYPLLREDLEGRWETASETERRGWLRTGIVPLDYPDPVAADWPEVLAIVEQRVRPERERLPPKNSINRERRTRWWRHGGWARGLDEAVRTVDRVLVISQITSHIAFAFLPTPMVYSQRLYVFAEDRNGFFACLQSRIHELWCRTFGSTLEDRPVYSGKDCFNNFPLPPRWASLPSLDAKGGCYSSSRAACMVANQEGLTKTYNRFHDPDETDPRILRLRELHDAMDRAVLDAYGWDDIPTACDFHPVHTDTEESESPSRRKARRYRYRWPDEVQDEVLGRLLDLNARRAAEERAR